MAMRWRRNRDSRCQEGWSLGQAALLLVPCVERAWVLYGAGGVLEAPVTSVRHSLQASVTAID